jgi:hypothetical protein
MMLPPAMAQLCFAVEPLEMDVTPESPVTDFGAGLNPPVLPFPISP